MFRLISATKTANYVVMSFSGRIDSSSILEFQQLIDHQIESKEIHLALNLNNVDFLSLPAIQLMVKYSDQLRVRRGSFVLVSPMAQVFRHLEVYAGRTSLRIFRSAPDFDKGLIPQTKRAEFGTLDL